MAFQNGGPSIGGPCGLKGRPKEHEMETEVWVSQMLPNTLLPSQTGDGPLPSAGKKGGISHGVACRSSAPNSKPNVIHWCKPSCAKRLAVWEVLVLLSSHSSALHDMLSPGSSEITPISSSFFVTPADSRANRLGCWKRHVWSIWGGQGKPAILIIQFSP